MHTPLAHVLYYIFRHIRRAPRANWYLECVRYEIPDGETWLRTSFAFDIWHHHLHVARRAQNVYFTP